MEIYFAACGSDRLPYFTRIHNERNHDRVILFSFYDLTLGGFQFRKISWKELLNE